MKCGTILKCSRLAGMAMALAIATAVPWKFEHGATVVASNAFGYAQSPILDKFVDQLPLASIDGSTPYPPAAGNQVPTANTGQYIPVATPTTGPDAAADYYTIGIVEFREKMSSGLNSLYDPNETDDYGHTGTLLRGYVDLTADKAANPHYLGPLIVARRDKPVRVVFRNLLPAGNMFLPVDTSLMGADGPQNRTAVHLHGGNTPWISDGTPNEWFTPDGLHGVSYQSVPDMTVDPMNEWGAYFTNADQCARMLWFHDHAVGITRLNVYAGMAGAWIIRDAAEDQLIAEQYLPDIGIPLIIQDKSFVPADIATQDPTWDTNTWGGPGNLWYPHVYEPNQDITTGALVPTGRWDYGGWVYPPVQDVTPPPDVSAVAEAFQDTSMVNGTAYPYLNVERRKYRFRILNAAGARGYNLQLYYETKDIENNYTKDADLNQPGPPILQIGNDGGWMPAPVEFNNPPQTMAGGGDLKVAPAERADILIDFANIPVGSRLILYSDMPAPAPDGDPRDDYFTGDPDQTASGGAPSTQLGKGPNTRTVMEFRVIDGGSADTHDYAATKAYLENPETGLPAIFKATQPAYYVPSGTQVTVRDYTVAGIPVYIKTLNENFDKYGRLLTQLGTSAYRLGNQGIATYGTGYDEMPTETTYNGQPQVWNIVNNTGDVHPIHFHLNTVQFVTRMGWDGQPIPIDPNEQGWKETIRMNPGENAIVAVKFTLPNVPFLVPDSIRPVNASMPVSETNPLHFFGQEYIWHCHMLEHEEHDMMHVIEVYRVVPPSIDYLLLQ